MAWSEAVLAEYDSRIAAAKIGGGTERIKKQHEKGKLTARERVDLLLDEGSFHELNMLSEARPLDFETSKPSYPGDGVVTGYGSVDGRLVFVVSHDATISGGAGGEEYVNKVCRVLEKAIEVKAPFINLNDSGGARIEEGICSLASYSRLFYLNTVASGLIPHIAAIMGNCAGGAAYSPILCDFLFMVKKTSQMYITGPQVVKSVMGTSVTAEELGGTDVHSKANGQAHVVFDGERECIEGIRALLSYLPKSCEETPPRERSFDFVDVGPLEDLVPDDKRRPYDVVKVVEAIVDKDSFFEIQREYAKNVVVGFARIKGRPLGVVANQPNHQAGAIDCDAADKMARFVRVCDCFNVPLLTLVDVPAFLPGIASEKAGIIKHGSKILFAFSEATVPKVAVILRKAYGGAYCAMNSKNMSADIAFAWPICEIAVMGAEGAVNVICRREIEAADNPGKKRRELIRQYEEDYLNPYYAASRGFVDEVILPQETREKVASAFEMLNGKQQYRPWKKHGNIPL